MKAVGCEEANDFIQRKREQKKCSSPSAETENLLSLQNKNYEDIANRSKDDRIRELKAALRKAQKEAKLEKLRTKAYEAIEAFVQYIPLR